MSNELHGAIGVVEEFSKYQSIPQIRQLMDRWVWLWVWPLKRGYVIVLFRLNSLQYDLGQQIRVDFEKAFSVKGVSVRGRVGSNSTLSCSTENFNT